MAVSYLDLNAALNAWNSGNFKTHKECADFLGWPTRTFSDRLSKAKIKLGHEHSPAKILLFDIELSHNISLHYGMWNINVPYKWILQHQRMLSASWQWFDEENKNPISNVNILQDKKRWKGNCWDIRKGLSIDDYHVVKGLYSAVEQADIVIGHNSDRFDIKHLNTMAERHGLPALPENKSVDTLKIAKSKFAFPSNSLDNICDYLQIPGKMETSKDLMMLATLGHEPAIEELAEYNDRDIAPSLRGLYLRMRPHIKNHPNVNALRHSIGCKNCQALGTLIVLGRPVIAGAKVRNQYRCTKCTAINKLTVAEEKNLMEQMLC